MIIGLVGKPSCGKSTFFKASTLAEVDIANYPFTTITKNEGIGFVRVYDAAKDFGKVSNPREGFVLGDKRFVPVQLIDVAGLVPGAHEGKGMGSKFLDDLRQADVLIHVVDISGSTNEKGESVEPGSYDPANDVRFLEEELDFWILRLMKKGWEKFSRSVQQTNDKVHKAITRHIVGLGVTEEIVIEVIEQSDLSNKKIVEWTDDDLLKLGSAIRKRTKPMIIACNKIDVKGAFENFERIKGEFPDYNMIKCSAESELALREAAKHELISYVPGDNSFEIKDLGKLSDKQKTALEFLKAGILDKMGGTGVQDVLDKAVFELLSYIAIFPGGVNKLEDQNGNVLPDCFLMPKDTTALDFAYRLHTDFGDNFIRAIDVKTKRTVGKEYKLKHGDIMEIVADK